MPNFYECEDRNTCPAVRLYKEIKAEKRKYKIKFYLTLTINIIYAIICIVVIFRQF